MGPSTPRVKSMPLLEEEEEELDGMGGVAVSRGGAGERGARVELSTSWVEDSASRVDASARGVCGSSSGAS